MNLPVDQQTSLSSTWLSRRRALSFLAASPWGLSGLAGAAETRGPMRFVVGFPPGGGGDMLARTLAEQLKSAYEPLVVDNRPGAGSRIALEYVKNAKNDGSVLIFAPDFTLTMFPHIYSHLSYDPLRSFTPVATLAESVIALTVGPLVPDSVKTLSDYVRWVKQGPKVAHYGTGGAGSLMDIAGKLFGRAAGIEVNHVAYRGGAPAIQELVGGQIPAAITGVLEPREFVRAGKLRVLATSGPRRWRTYPDVPTFVEAGYRDLMIVSWFALLAPADTSAPIIERINAQVNSALNSPAVTRTFDEFGVDAVVSKPAETAALIRKDHNRWGEVIRSLGYVPEA